MSFTRLGLSCSARRACRSLSTGGPSPVPWFLDPEPASSSQPFSRPNRLEVAAPPIPEGTPQALRDLHAQLISSPYLEPGTLLVTRPWARDGPELPHRLSSGRRRKRGGTYAGESMYDMPGGLWSWLMLAEVKEGTEDKGSIDSVVRAVRKTLLEIRPPLPIPANSKRRMHNGWALVDAGDFAVHVVSKPIRERYFSRI